MLVVIPCSNQAHFLDQAIEGALRQNYSNIETIVADDGSIEDYAIYEVSDRAEVQSSRNMKQLSTSNPEGAQINECNRNS